MSVEEYEKEKAEGHNLFDDSMYHVISLAKGQFYEVGHFTLNYILYYNVYTFSLMLIFQSQYHFLLDSENTSFNTTANEIRM